MSRVTKDDLSHCIEVSLNVLEALDTPVALSCWILIRHKEYRQLVEKTINPLHYEDWIKFRSDYAAVKLLSKSKFLETGIDKRKVATDSFSRSEAQCKLTNDRFLKVRQGLASHTNRCVDPILHGARRKISNFLGILSVDKVFTDANFGPGADFSTRGGFTAAYNKVASNGSVTASAIKWLNLEAGRSRICLHLGATTYPRDPNRFWSQTETVRGNKVTFVPKNAKTDRAIAVEPRWNVYLQKGVGSHIRKRLRMFGCNLDDQTLSQRRALEASASGLYATMDLSSASDTISREVVWDLLPYDWASLLDDLRSKSYLDNKRWVPYEKFSSMGNGFTFELESMIFYAVALSTCEFLGLDTDVVVYGDDIIVPSKAYHVLSDVLHSLGFSVNMSKSFSEGYFRESCGMDAFGGHDVTPIYIKELPHGERAIILANQICRLATRFGGGHFRDRRFRRAWLRVVDRIPRNLKFFGPTTVFAIHDSKKHWSGISRRWSWDGWFIDALGTKPIKFGFREYDPAVTHVLLQPTSHGYSIRDRSKIVKVRTFIPVGVKDLGDWV